MNETIKNFLEWLDQQPLVMETEIRELRRIVESEERMRLLLDHAVRRVELANREGNPILSAWRPQAEAALKV